MNEDFEKGDCCPLSCSFSGVYIYIYIFIYDYSKPYRSMTNVS